MSVDCGTLVGDEIEDCISLTVDLVAEREASGVEHLKNAVLDEDWYGHERVTNDSVVGRDTSI